MSKPALAVLIVLVLIGLAHVAAARDRGQYAQVDPELGAWFKGLKNSRNVPCCDTSDGRKVEDADWRRNDDGTFSAKIDGEWKPIPPDAVLTEPNRAGYAIVWIWHGIVMCFMPGTEG